MASYYFRATFGGIALLVVEVDTDGGHDLAVQSPIRGDRHVVQDRGQVVHRSRLEVLFVDQVGLEPYLDRFRAFLARANGGAQDLFSHPIEGSYRAQIEEFRYSVGADEQAVRVQCTMVGVEEPDPVLPSGASVSPAAGIEEVSATVAKLGQELDEAGVASPVPTSCLATVTAWTEAEDPDSRSVSLELQSLASQIADEVDRLELATDLSRWEIYRQVTFLQYQLQRAAESVTSETARVFDLRIDQPIPLRVLCAQIYPGDDNERRCAQVMRANNLRSPLLLPAGTDLKMPAPTRTG